MRANRVIFLGGIPVVLILALVVFALVKFAAGEREEQSWIAHSYEVIDSLRAILADGLDAETGQRGYLLTRKPSYLKPFHAAEARLDRDIDRFRLLTRDNPKNQKRAEELRKMFADRFKVLNAGIILSPYVPSLPPELVSTLETSRLGLQSSAEGLALLKDIFNADRFEAAPRMGYRALYRVALASL